MRYINREYGFTFRPPFFDKFYEESPKGPPLKEHNFPNKYIIGVGYDYSAINGAMLIGKNGSLWGIKVSYYNGRKWLDNDDFILNMGTGCANTTDGSFAHFSSGPLSVKWAKHNDQAIALEVSARKRLRVRIICYPCHKWPADLSIEGSYVKGRSPIVGIIPGQIALNDNNAVYKDRFQVVADDNPQREYFIAQSYNKPIDSANGAFNEAIMEFIVGKNQPCIYLYAMVGDEKIFAADVPRMDKIVGLIETYELRYGVNKTSGSGALGRPVENMFNSILWSRIYYPYLLSTIFSPKRSSLNYHFDISGVEENCAALLGAYADCQMAENQLDYTVEDKIMALISAWHISCHQKDSDRIIELYKKFVKLYPCKNDRPVVSKDDSKNEVAYKWTDSPLKELNKNTSMYSLDLSCLKLFAFDILERVALLYDLPDASDYGSAKLRLKKHINDIFWNEQQGIYMNRYVTGVWANYVGATSFYPLLCGAVDTQEKMSALISNLSNPKKFWNDYMIPTLSKDSKNYGKKGKPNEYGKCAEPYMEYRGSIVPYVNYIIYMGLRRYGLDEIAGELAYKSVRLWQNNDSSNVENYSMYLPTGKRVKNSEYLSNNGNMLALMGVQELIDLEYFRNDIKTALRFGTFVRGNHSITNLKMHGKSYSVDVNNLNTTLLVDNHKLFFAEGGRCIVRQFVNTPNGCEFIIDAKQGLNITITLPQENKKPVPVVFSAPEGKSRVLIEDSTVNIQVI